MDNSLTNYGETFKRIRRQKGFSIEALSEASAVSVSTIKRLESGKYEPQLFNLRRLLSTLGATLEDLFQLMHGVDIEMFNADFARIFDAGFKRDVQKMSELFDELKTKPYCNPQIPFIKQALLLIEANISTKNNSNYNAHLALYYEALSITMPSKIFNDSSELIYEDIVRYKLSMNEYRILKGISNSYSRLGDIQKAINTYEMILLSLESDNANYEIKKKQLPTTYFNLSNLLLDDRQCVKALEIIDKGIDFCLSTAELKVISHLRWNKGRALFYLGETKLATDFFQTAYSQCKDVEDESMLSTLRKSAETEYFILLQ